MKIELFYDNECPLCRFYSKYLKIKQMHDLILIDVREHENEIYAFKLKGFDINNGFIIKVDNSTIYQGADAIIFLNQLVEKKLYFPNNRFFKNIIYPMLKQFRRGMLFIMGKKLDL